MVANVDVWIIDIDRCAGAIQTCWIEAVATHGERAIAPVDPASPSKATIEHAVRLLLARDIGLRAALHPFERSPSGKPAPAARSIHFSISDTGGLAERGDGDGFGANVNVPLMPGCGHGAYVATFERVVVPALERFAPELIIVASGYDAGGFDAMAHMMCHSGTFAAMAAMMIDVADRHCQGRLVVLHEGGYSPFHVPFCGLAVIEQLTGVPSGVADPYATLANLPYQDLQPHQDALIERVAELVDDVPAG